MNIEMTPVNYSIQLCLSLILGGIIGSFLNVCIYRIPARESIVHPPSRCPQCGITIRWYQNVPLLSYIFLGGRCTGCRVHISLRYPLVETLTGLLFGIVFWRFDLQWATPGYWVFVAALIVISFIDVDHQIIPDVISIPGIVVGFLFSFFVPWMSWTDSLLGILAGGGSLYLVAGGYQMLTKKEGMGGGDIKLLAMIGAFLGWKAVLPVIFLSSFMGTTVGVPLMLIKRTNSKLAIPFGPFLAAAAIVYLFWGNGLIRWYLHLF